MGPISASFAGESPPDKMAKSKNHTNHNQNRKAHRNPSRKPKVHIHASMGGVCPKFKVNLRFSRKGNLPYKAQLERCKERQAARLARKQGKKTAAAPKVE